MSQYHLEFEKPIIELEEKIAALQSFKERSTDESPNDFGKNH